MFGRETISDISGTVPVHVTETPGPDERPVKLPAVFMKLRDLGVYSVTLVRAAQPSCLRAAH